MRVVDQELSVRDRHVERHRYRDFRHDGFVGGVRVLAIYCFCNSRLVIVCGLGCTVDLFHASLKYAAYSGRKGAYLMVNFALWLQVSGTIRLAL